MSAIVQTQLISMLRTAKDVAVSIKYDEKKINKFFALFYVDGAEAGILYTDAFKPRLMKTLSDVESIIRRSCEEITTLRFDIDTGQAFIKNIPTFRLSDRKEKISLLAWKAQDVKEQALTEFNDVDQNWDAGQKKTAKLTELSEVIKCAENIISYKESTGGGGDGGGGGNSPS